MFELYCPATDMIHGIWQIHTKSHGAYEGDYISIIRICIRELEISETELDVAVQEMCKKNHNCAHFGIFRTFLFTYNREQKRVG